MSALRHQSPTAPGAPAPSPNGGRRVRLLRPDRWLRRPIGRDGATVGNLVRLGAFGLVLVLVLSVALAPWNAVSRVDLPVGAVADRTLKAPRSITYVSAVRTQEQRDEAASDERLTVWTRDAAVAARQQSQLDSALRTLAELRDGSAPLDDRIRAAQSAMDGLSKDDAQQLLTLDASRWPPVTQAARDLLAAVMQQEIRPEDLARTKDDLPNRSNPPGDELEFGLAVALARPFVKPNMIEDTARSQANRDAARARVAPQTVTLQAGQTIVRDGDIVTKDQREMLEKVGLLKPQIHWSALLGTVGLVAVLIALLLTYLYRFCRDIWRGRRLLLLLLTIAVPVILARLTLGTHPTWIYAFPIATAVMLATVLLNVQLAVVVASLLAVALGLLGGPSGSLEFMVLAFVAGLAGAFVLWRADRIATFLWAGVAVSAAVFVAGVCFGVIAGTLSVVGAAQLALYALFNGGLSAILTFGSFSFLGGLFGVTTHLQLLELAHPNQPLLYKLAREAPGTYHHSIVVSNLAESAVELVGGDPLFTRVAVLYHDIGKTLRPTFFIENQANRDNVHDALDPKTSAQIILDHVTDGVRLAQKARLPAPIVDVIRQHHGTTLLRYFYNKALEQGDEVREEDFRYRGPRPQTKEAGVIMLADSVEATVRATAQAGKLRFDDAHKNGKTPANAVGSGTGPFRTERHYSSKLQELVEQVIDDIVKRGQLDECDLTLRDITLIKRTFVQVLDGIYHPRIEYPQAPRQEGAARRPDGAEPAPAPAAALEGAGSRAGH
ncbi:MAG TPA: HDIG domain-containing protein [Thermomicrobiales bacterium]|nr:HDIG domain-containing protein [Thermomicrobiales bacterium]